MKNGRFGIVITPECDIKDAQKIDLLVFTSQAFHVKFH
jgi:hypothetical protein